MSSKCFIGILVAGLILIWGVAALSQLEEGSTMPAEALGEDYLPNSSFETKTADGDGIEGWARRAWAGEEDVRWSVESPGREGGRCVSIRSERGGDAAWSATARVERNAWYRLSGWIRTRDVHGAIGALLNIQNMQTVRTAAVSGTRDWTPVSVVFQAEAAELEINCLFGGWGMSTGQAWFDDVTLVPADPADIPRSGTEARVSLRTDVPAMPYSPMIFGGFLEHFGRQVYGGVFEPGSPLADENGFRTDVLAALRELKTPVVRWPGGCYASGYHWELGVGRDRRPTDDMAWGVIEPNTFGTDEFVRLSRLAGWAPYICNNAGNGTVEEMRNWVEYCNARDGARARMRGENGQAEPWNVRIWSIGNENYGSWEIGHRPIEQWAPLVLEAARAMKAADPSIHLSAAANEAYAPLILQLAGPYLDYISIHGYWIHAQDPNDLPGYLTCIMQSDEPEARLAGFVRVLDSSGYRGRIKIAFDEWNLRGWHHPGFPRKTVQDYDDPEVARLVKAREHNDVNAQYTMADALFSASFLNACLRHADDVGMANIAPLINTRGPLFVHPGGIVRRTHFHTLAMYANLLKERVGGLEVDADRLYHGTRSVAVVDAVATVDGTGRQWAIALVNRHPSEPAACTIGLDGRPLDGAYPATVLAGDSPDAFNDVDHPDRVAPERTMLIIRSGVAALPPHSLTIVEVPADGGRP